MPARSLGEHQVRHQRRHRIATAAELGTAASSTTTTAAEPHVHHHLEHDDHRDHDELGDHQEGFDNFLAKPSGSRAWSM